MRTFRLALAGAVCGALALGLALSASPVSAQTPSTACRCLLFAFASGGSNTANIALGCKASEAACEASCTARVNSDNLGTDFTRGVTSDGRALDHCQCIIDPPGAPATCSASQTTSGSQQASSAAATIAAANPLAGLDARGAIGRVIRLFTGLIGSLALLMYVYGGFQYLTAGGDDKKVANAMGTFKWTTIGLVTVFSSYAVVNQLFTSIETNLVESGGGYADIYPLGQNTTPAELAGRVIRVLLGLSGVIALLMFMWGGWQYFASQGDAKSAEQGRKTIINAVIGLVAIFTAYSITQFVIEVIERGLA